MMKEDDPDPNRVADDGTEATSAGCDEELGPSPGEMEPEAATPAEQDAQNTEKKWRWFILGTVLTFIILAVVLGVYNAKDDDDSSDDAPQTKDPQPVIFDTDYRALIDDVFALGLIVNSGDLLDLKMVIKTSENPELSGKCVAKHLDISGRPDVLVAIGSEFPPHNERGSVCAIRGLVPNVLEDECKDVDLPLEIDGIEAMMKMIMDSGRDDWWYIVTGGQTTLKDFIDKYPGAAAKIDTVIIMAGNWCAGFEPYPDVPAPTDETNIGCDPAAANLVLDGAKSPIKNVYYVPVVMADEIGGDDYLKIVEAANSGADPGAAATLHFYRLWSAAGRNDTELLIHLEALAYDPETESTPQFDPCAIMVALELLDDKKCEDRVSLFDFEAVHFLEAGEGEAWPGAPRSAFSLHTGEVYDLPEQCPALTEYTFNEDETPEYEIPVTIALGYKSADAKNRFYADMASRMAGEIPVPCR